MEHTRVSGFEAAIRNALVRSSSGTADARQRVYAAARASLERNLARVNADEATATAQRQRLETTIDGIEVEWSGRAREAVASVTPTAPPPADPAPGPPPVPTAPTVSEPTPPEPTVPMPVEPERAPQPDTVERAVPAISTPSSQPAAPDETAPVDQPDLPDFARVSATRSSNEARLMEPPPDEVTEPRRNRDPFFASETTAPPTLPRQANIDLSASGNVANPESDSDRAVPAEPSLGSRVEPAVEAPRVEADTPTATNGATVGTVEGPISSPAIGADERRAKTGSERERARSERRQRRTAEKEQRRERRRQRRPFRALAFLLVIGALGAAYYWITDTGLLEARDTNVDAITDVDERPQTASEAAGPSEWIEVFTLEGNAFSGAAEMAEVDSEPVVRVDGNATLTLNSGALRPLGDRIRIAVALRASEEGNAIAFVCSGSLSCGRKRFVAPRELGELLFEVDVTSGADAILNVDPKIGGGDGSVEIMAIRATAI